jgi:hypothetical protein
MGKFFSITFILTFTIPTAFVPIIYIATLISYWMISKFRWIKCH